MAKFQTDREAAVKQMTEDAVSEFDEIGELAGIADSLCEVIRPHIPQAPHAVPAFLALVLKVDEIGRLAVEGTVTIKASMLLTGYPHALGLPEELGVSILDMERRGLRVSEVARACGIRYQRVYRIAHNKRPGAISDVELVAIRGALAA
jgi:hypothetical protein